MLADKHITGEGKGYCDITFGKESKKSLIINIQYNIFAPIIYMLLIATVLQNIGQEELAYKAVYIVPCYYLVRWVIRFFHSEDIDFVREGNISHSGRISNTVMVGIFCYGISILR